ncbi:MAG: TIGR03915 family putative DNA repair protein [Elusimicrobiales bacterium]|nr:TIGR03915 family putative DNA repair protein [Elusimicrobiales bacterium]
MNVTYDKSFEGYVTALKFALEYENSTISSEDVLGENINIKTQEEHDWAKAFYVELKTIYLSEKEGFENIALNYLRFVKNDINKKNDITNKWVNLVEKIKKSYFSELHRMKGFLRFMEFEKGSYIAKISTENNIIEDLGSYFKKRMKENFIIYDEKRKSIFIRIKDKSHIKKVENLRFQKTNEEIKIESLWKKFFNEIAIKERANEKLQKSKVPLKYRKTITEFINF